MAGWYCSCWKVRVAAGQPTRRRQPAAGSVEESGPEGSGMAGCRTAGLVSPARISPASRFRPSEQGKYARNKRIQVALTEWWAEKYNNKGVGFYSMHPGWADTPGVAKGLPGFSEKLSGNLRSNDEGADTVLWLALQPKEKLSPGAFYFDRAVAPKHLKFAGTMSSHSQINSIVDSIRSICGLPALG